MRNNYETRIGKFKGAVDPMTTAFREFPTWVEDQFQLDETAGQESNGSDEAGSPEKRMPKQVAMYCTGGIRCEKASSFLLSKGFKEVILSLDFQILIISLFGTLYSGKWLIYNFRFIIWKVGF